VSVWNGSVAVTEQKMVLVCDRMKVGNGMCSWGIGFLFWFDIGNEFHVAVMKFCPKKYLFIWRLLINSILEGGVAGGCAVTHMCNFFITLY